MQKGGQRHSLADFQRFNPEEDDLIGAFIQLTRNVKNFEDINFVKGQVRQLLYGLDLVGGEASDGAGFGSHPGTVDQDGFSAARQNMKQIQPAGSAVIKLDAVSAGDFAFSRKGFQPLNQDDPDALVGHQRIAQPDNDGFFCHCFTADEHGFDFI